MNIKINTRIRYAQVERFYLYDIDSTMCWQGKYWIGSLKQAKLFDSRKEAEEESRRQYTILNILIKDFSM